MKFDYVVSLGANCEVAEHVRRHFGIKRTYPFDWWITPFDSCIKLIESDFHDLFAEISMDRQYQAVLCNRYAIYHHHDFRRDEREHVIEHLIELQIPELVEKFSTLVARLHDDLTAGRKVLFVRSWREILHEGQNYPRHLIRGVPRYNFEGLINAIAGRFPDIDFRCLFINYGDQSSSDPRALFHNIEDKGDIANWSGSALGWDAMFSLLDIRWELPAHTPTS